MSTHGRVYEYVWVTDEWWRDRGEQRYLIYRDLIQVADGTTYQGTEMCVPLEKCTDEERRIAAGLQEIRAMTPNQLDRLGRLADKADNCVAASKLPSSLQLQKTCLAEAMVEVRDELRRLVIELGGVNLWVDATDLAPPPNKKDVGRIR